MSRTGLTYGAADVYEALFFMEADPKALKGKEDGVFVFEYTEEIRKAHEVYVKNPGAAKISLGAAQANFAKLGISLEEGAGPKRRGRKPGRKPGRPAGKKPGRKPGRPAGKKRGRKPGRPAGSGRKPGRPAGSGRKPGRPAGSGRKPGRPAGSGRKPGRPAGSGVKPGRPPKKKTAIKLVPPEQRAKIDAEVKALLDQKKDKKEIVAALKGKFGGQAVAGSLRRMK